MSLQYDPSDLASSLAIRFNNYQHLLFNININISNLTNINLAIDHPHYHCNLTIITLQFKQSNIAIRQFL
jgi:hypothetical protein